MIIYKAHRWIVAVALIPGLVLVLLGYRMITLSREHHLSAHGEFPDFKGMAVTSIAQKPIQKADLHGNPWIANFFFASCRETCPLQTRQMAKLQKDLHRDIRLVSFTVDPENDKPDILQTFARFHGADLERWFFVRTNEKILDRLLSGLKLAVPNNPSQPPSSRLNHSTKCILIDGNGEVRGYYECLEDESLEVLKRDAHELLNEKSQ